MSNSNFPFGTGPEDYERSAGFICEKTEQDVYDESTKPDEYYDDEPDDVEVERG